MITPRPLHQLNKRSRQRGNGPRKVTVDVTVYRESSEYKATACVRKTSAVKATGTRRIQNCGVHRDVSPTLATAGALDGLVLNLRSRGPRKK